MIKSTGVTNINLLNEMMGTTDNSLPVGAIPDPVSLMSVGTTSEGEQAWSTAISAITHFIILGNIAFLFWNIARGENKQ